MPRDVTSNADTAIVESRYCNALKRNGQRCRAGAGQWTDHSGAGNCKVHGGNMRANRLYGARVLADRAARAALGRFGVPIEIDPQEALLAMVWEAAGNVAWLGTQVQKMEEQDLLQPVGQPRDGLGKFRSPLIGDIIDATRGGEFYESQEEVRAIVRLYGEWTDRLVKYSKAAIDAGIEERKVRVAEEQGKTIVLAVSNVLVQIGVPEDKILQARSLLAAEFRTLSAGTLVRKVGP